MIAPRVGLLCCEMDVTRILIMLRFDTYALNNSIYGLEVAVILRMSRALELNKRKSRNSIIGFINKIDAIHFGKH